MNATANTTATAFPRPLFTPTTADLKLVPAGSLVTELFYGDRLAVKIIGRHNEIESSPTSFTAGSVAGYAASYNEDPEAKVAWARSLGHNIHYLNAEVTMIALHPEKQPERKVIELGSLVTFDGHLYQVLQAPNRNLTLVPVING